MSVLNSIMERRAEKQRERIRDLRTQLDAMTERAEKAESLVKDLRGSIEAQDRRDELAADAIDTLKAENARLIEYLNGLPELVRTYWTFDNNQQHTHSWHTREDFIGLLINQISSLSAKQPQD